MRIYFDTTAAEYATIQNNASGNGYSSTSKYSKNVAITGHTYNSIWKQIEDGIEDLPAGQTFAVSDFAQAPPANIGVKLYKKQKDLGIAFASKVAGVNTYTKL